MSKYTPHDMGTHDIVDPDAFREVVLEVFYEFYKGNAKIKSGPRNKVSEVDIWKELTNMGGKQINRRRELDPVLSYLRQTGHIKKDGSSRKSVGK
jgi:hypothetical protein